MSAYILGIVGITVSMGLFLIGYRQTIGAKKERVNSANAEIEKILVRRIVLEGYTPNPVDVSRLLEGKARDFRVRAADLLSESQILNSIFTRVVETDFIPQNQREEILKRLVPAIADAESEPIEEEAITELPTTRRQFLARTIALVAMGVIASLLGGLIAILPKLGTLQVKFSEILPAVGATFTASLVLIAFLVSFYRLRESQEETSKSSTLARSVGFEREVVNVLEKAGFRLKVAGLRDEGYDFAFDRGGKKILVEIKAWSRPMPTRIVKRIAERLRQVAERERASEAIIVTPKPVRMPSHVLDEDLIRIMTLHEMRNYLTHGAAQLERR